MTHKLEVVCSGICEVECQKFHLRFLIRRISHSSFNILQYLRNLLAVIRMSRIYDDLIKRWGHLT